MYKIKDDEKEETFQCDYILFALAVAEHARVLVRVEQIDRHITLQQHVVDRHFGVDGKRVAGVVLVQLELVIDLERAQLRVRLLVAQRCLIGLAHAQHLILHAIELFSQSIHFLVGLFVNERHLWCRGGHRSSCRLARLFVEGVRDEAKYPSFLV